MIIEPKIIFTSWESGEEVLKKKAFVLTGAIFSEELLEDMKFNKIIIERIIEVLEERLKYEKIIIDK